MWCVTQYLHHVITYRPQLGTTYSSFLLTHSPSTWNLWSFPRFWSSLLEKQFKSIRILLAESEAAVHEGLITILRTSINNQLPKGVWVQRNDLYLRTSSLPLSSGSFFQHFCQNSVGRKLTKSQNSTRFLAKTPTILRKTQFSNKNIELLLHKTF